MSAVNADLFLRGLHQLLSLVVMLLRLCETLAVLYRGCVSLLLLLFKLATRSQRIGRLVRLHAGTAHFGGLYVVIRLFNAGKQIVRDPADDAYEEDRVKPRAALRRLARPQTLAAHHKSRAHIKAAAAAIMIRRQVDQATILARYLFHTLTSTAG